MKLKRTTELLDEMVNEALQHTDRRRSEHNIRVKSADSFILVKADARLIMQVIINLVDNAIQSCARLDLETKKDGDQAVVTVSITAGDF